MTEVSLSVAASLNYLKKKAKQKRGRRSSPRSTALLVVVVWLARVHQHFTQCEDFFFLYITRRGMQRWIMMDQLSLSSGSCLFFFRSYQLLNEKFL